MAGFIASWAMEQFQQRFSQAIDDGADARQRATGYPEAWDARWQDGLNGAATAAASAAAIDAAGIPSGPDDRAHLAQGLHYAFGITVGAAYGVAAESDPRVTRLAGIPFGLGVWAAAEELSVSWLGLAPPPAERPPLAHTYSLLSHVVYGVTTEAVRRFVRRALPPVAGA